MTVKPTVHAKLTITGHQRKGMLKTLPLSKTKSASDRVSADSPINWRQKGAIVLEYIVHHALGYGTAQQTSYSSASID
ncbi:hypothetical protein TNCV_1810731 [Trichonephila clavipes]|nr:hypothetical protein TNCV_1810731 [Trichonephila clavipes]